MIQVAFSLRIKELPKCLYQKEADFLLISRDLQEKSPTVQEVETVGQTFLFFRRF